VELVVSEFDRRSELLALALLEEFATTASPSGDFFVTPRLFLFAD
jgi:hypothetical protein